MPFESAELKTLAEAAWAEGIPLSASQAGHYFYYHQLSTLVDQAITIARDRRAAANAYWSATKDRTRLRALVVTITAQLNHATTQRAHYLALYQAVMVQIALYDDIAYQISSLQREIADFQYRLNEALILRYEAQDYLNDAIDERDAAYSAIDYYEEEMNYWEDEVISYYYGWQDCMDEEEEEPWRCEDLEEEYRDANAAFDRAGELYNDADDEYAWWRREVWDLEDQLDYYTELYYDADYNLRYLSADLVDLRSQAGDIGRLTTDRYYYLNLYYQWRDNVFTYTNNLGIARQELVRAEADYVTTYAEMTDMNAMYERMIDRWW